MKINRRDFVETIVVAGAAGVLPAQAAQQTGNSSDVSLALTINGESKTLQLDPRVTLLDLLRERLHLAGTKKGCGHGQCGACTVLVNGIRVNSCLSLAVTHDGDNITTIEGLAKGGELHPMQSAFLQYDGFQCGYCTPGQICSAVALQQEVKAGAPSFVTKSLEQMSPIELTDDEIRERMSGNICRCAAYPNIVAAIRSVQS
jgi:xanthine dehydrogenase YagT iron-sulfur-binding subunit